MYTDLKVAAFRLSFEKNVPVSNYEDIDNLTNIELATMVRKPITACFSRRSNNSLLIYRALEDQFESTNHVEFEFNEHQTVQINDDVYAF